MKTVLAIIAEARDKYTVHECSECTCRKSCDMNAYGFDTPECKGKRESIALALGVDDGYFTQILDRLEAAAKRDRTEIEANALAIGGVVEASRKKHSGNAAAMREALLKAIVLLQACEWPDDAPMQDITEVMDEIEKALSWPARNCDVPHKDGHELWVRWQAYCAEIYASRMNLSTWLLDLAQEGGAK